MITLLARFLHPSNYLACMSMAASLHLFDLDAVPRYYLNRSSTSFPCFLGHFSQRDFHVMPESFHSQISAPTPPSRWAQGFQGPQLRSKGPQVVWLVETTLVNLSFKFGPIGAMYLTASA
ncbi:hypothetical protein BDM02DRAFT_1796842 [Thelephora ganbajun]|uniref:Uncharacterized protein n=1 Tax=Thelephora ganbajun TaxID=370292 RepID=A0ACB6Z0P7_THEGA|nr:hypothetical protein BDM02DRAFT_1796842 [Thelephora ganbajun]